MARLLFLMPLASGDDIQMKPCPILNHFPAQKEVLVPLGPDHEDTMLATPKSLVYGPWHTKIKGKKWSEDSGLCSVEVKSFVHVKH